MAFPRSDKPGPSASWSVDAALLRRSPTDLVLLLSTTVKALQEQAQELGIELTIDAEPTCRAGFDRERIAWAIVTLMRNAFRHVVRAPVRLSGGSICVRVRSEPG